MLLNCDSHCCEQMVAGSSSKGCHQRQNCSPNNNLDLTSQTSRSYHSSPEQNDQNCDRECQLITQNQYNKGTKRRNETVDGGLATVVLSSVSTNVAPQQQQQQQQQTNCHKGDGSSLSMTPQVNSIVMPARCTGDKCPAYSSPPPQEYGQCNSLMDTSGPTGAESAGNDGGDEGCESCCDAEELDYESVLTTILNEKKLALSRSVEVINFLQQLPRSKETGVNRDTERQTSQ